MKRKPPELDNRQKRREKRREKIRWKQQVQRWKEEFGLFLKARNDSALARQEAYLNDIRYYEHNGRPMYYGLDGHEPVACSLKDWSTMFSDPDARVVALDHIGPYSISTVFLGMDHQYGDGPPLLFETMVFSEHAPKISMEEGQITVKSESPLLTEAYPDIDLMDRYPTWTSAEAGHASIMAEIEAIMKERMDASLLDNG